MHRGNVDPEVSELPRGNELSRDHVNRPLESSRVSLKSHNKKVCAHPYPFQIGINKK